LTQRKWSTAIALGKPVSSSRAEFSVQQCYPREEVQKESGHWPPFADKPSRLKVGDVSKDSTESKHKDMERI
jgi:hypothetical protein